MRCGFMGMMLKPRCNHHSGWRKGFLDQKVWMSCSKIKVTLVVFFGGKGIVHHEFVPRGQMVNKQLYQEVLVRLRDAVRRGLNCGKTRLGCCTMTMHWLTHHSSSAVIWQNIRHLLCPIHPILRTWPQQTFSSFPNLKPLWKDVISKP